MSNISIKEIDNLNKRIEKINNEYMKKKSQQDLLKERLEKEILAYKDEFGVDLSGNSVKETKNNIITEHKKVVSSAEKEYEIKLKVVKAIEEGDYDEAASILGIKPEVSEDLSNKDEDEDDIEENVMSLNNQNIEVSNTIEIEDTEDVENDDFGFEDEISEESESNEEVLSTKEDDFGFDELSVEESEISLELEVEETEVSSNDFMSAVAGSSVKDAFNDMTSNSSEDIFSGLEIEDDDDSEDDFGFGDMLSGTKFEN